MMALELTGQAVDGILLSKVEASIGTYRDSDLDVAIFNEQNLGTWMLCNGQSSAGTEYFSITGKANVPDFVSDGSFRRQAKVGRGLGTPEGQATAKNGLTASTSSSSVAAGDHSHRQRVTTAAGSYLQHGSAAYNGNSVFTNSSTDRTEATGSHSHTITSSTSLSGDAETRPNNHACNVFIKVSHT